MRLTIPEYYPWGDPTHYVPKIYAGLPPESQKHYFYGILKSLKYWPNGYEREQYGYKYFHIIEFTEEAIRTHTVGSRVHFHVLRNGFGIRFCRPLTLLNVQEIEVLWEGESMILFIDGLELPNDNMEMFVREGGFDTLDVFKRNYPRDFRGISLHWEYQLI